MEQAVLYSLDNDCIDSALFLSEQLHHSDKSNHYHLFLHALCLLRAGHTYKAHLLTQATRHLGCAYVYAKTCLTTKSHKAGIAALVALQSIWQGTSHFYLHSETSRRLMPDAAAVNCLLGHLYTKENEVKKAIEHYVIAVKSNPYLWEAFEGLLNLGVDMQVRNVFKLSDTLAKSRAILDDGGCIENETLNDPANPLATPDVFGNLTHNTKTKNYTFRPTMPLTRLDEFETPNGPATPTMATEFQKSAFDSVNSTIVPVKARPKSRLPDLTAPKFGLGKTTADANGLVRRSSTRDDNASTSGPARRSSRLNMPLSLRPKSQSTKKGRPLSAIDPDPTPQAAPRKAPSRSIVSLPTIESETTLLSLLRQVGEGCYHLSKFQCLKAIESFRSIDRKIQTAPYVLAKLGRAFYENSNYEEALLCYKDLRNTAPARLEDMELYSTCLWHLRKDVELSYLAHEMLDLDRLSPIAWCVLANCFSLQKEHDQALKCVKRAIQLDTSFAYAHTLEGHEYAANEEFERAQTSFRNAIRVDQRHYNAWYGLGMTYMKTGNNEQAEFHFTQAARINPTNAVLVCCIGIVLERVKRWDEALIQFNLAVQLSPSNALARFKKAKALIMARDYRSAMNELHVLKELAPDEANVHYLLGKMYKQSGDKVSAMKHLTIAMNLDNKASHLVKEAIENMDELDQAL